MNDMHNVYFNMTTLELRKLHSKKYLRHQRLLAKRMGYFEQQELRMLIQQMTWIEGVLESRKIQLSYMP